MVVKKNCKKNGDEKNIEKRKKLMTKRSENNFIKKIMIEKKVEGNKNGKVGGKIGKIKKCEKKWMDEKMAVEKMTEKKIKIF